MEPYIPSPLPLTTLDWSRLVRKIGTANAALARFDGILLGIPNPMLLLAPLALREAERSSRIEGTQATIEEVYAFEASGIVDEKKRNDIREILNYRAAMEDAITHLTRRPISLNLIKELHGTLMNSVRGHDKRPGSFRNTQVFIGFRGATIEEASYVPPPAPKLADLLDNFETYLHHDEKDKLVQLAIIHAQFEMIHPFADGNGRVGRILLPIFLYERNILSSPMFYLSEYLEAHRNEYINRLGAISAENDWHGWIEFFLDGVVAQASANGQKAKAILSLYESVKKPVGERTRSQPSMTILDTLFNMPIFSTTEFVRRTGIPRNSALRTLRGLAEEGVVAELQKGAGKRPGLYLFGALLDIIKR